ncbi:MAG: site-specific integrase [Saprospiraceae bacterium]|nr:site-specific integrase [Saprospiraceae bacterium]
MRKPHFAPKPDARFPHFQIYLQFTYSKGKLLRYYTGVTVPKEFWDKDKERAKQDRKFPAYAEINAQLKRIETEAEQIALRSQYNKSDLTNEVFKKELDTFLGKREVTDDTLTFFRYFQRFIEERAGNPNYSKGSIKVYVTTYNQLKAYADGVLRRDLNFADFNHAFFSDFSNHLFGKDYGNNYVHKLTSTLKTVLREADRREVTPDLKVRDGWLVATREEPPAIYLTEDELTKLFQLDLSGNQRLSRIRDLFLVGCYTGLRFSDFTELKPGNYKKTPDGKEYIEMMTQKTGTKVTIPVKSEVREIVSRYNYQLPKAISNQKFNDYLKEVGKLAGLDEPTMLTRFKNGKRVDQTFPKYELMTSHTARRSFASNAYKAGVPVRYVMTVTGHKTEKEFYKYVRIRPDEHALLVSDNPFFK